MNTTQREISRRSTHRRIIQDHLEKGRSITAVEALRLFGCFRLAARINELRNRGMRIETDMVDFKPTFGPVTKIASYRIAKPTRTKTNQ